MRPPKTRPSSAAYVPIKTGFIDFEKIIIMATTNPPIAPTKISGAAWGIEKAVSTAVVAVINSSKPVFSATPSIDIRLLSLSSHQLVSE